MDHGTRLRDFCVPTIPVRVLRPLAYPMGTTKQRDLWVIDIQGTLLTTDLTVPQGMNTFLEGVSQFAAIALWTQTYPSLLTEALQRINNAVNIPLSWLFTWNENHRRRFVWKELEDVHVDISQFGKTHIHLLDDNYRQISYNEERGYTRLVARPRTARTANFAMDDFRDTLAEMKEITLSS
jgi:hypothetical protein